MTPRWRVRILAPVNLDLSVAAADLRPEPLLLLLAALAIDAAIGGVLAHRAGLRGPAWVIDATALYLEPRLNRTRRGDTNRLIRGLLVVVVVLAASIVAGGAVALIGAAIPYGWVVVLVAILGLTNQRRPLEQGRAKVRRLERPISAAGAATAGAGDDYAVARAAIERLIEQLASGLVAASFWYVLLGLPGLAGYLAVNRLAARLDARQPRLAAFGFAASRLNEALSFLPGILAGFLIVAASLFVPGANLASAYRTMLRDFPNAHPRATGFALAALAGAFQINLSGPESHPAGWRGWIGDRGWRARVTSADVRRALYVYGVVCLLHMALIALLAMATFAL